MAYTNNDGVDETVPNGASDAASSLDTFIQDVKKAVNERMDYLFGGDFSSSTEQTIERLRGAAEFYGAGKQAVQTAVNLGTISGTVAVDFDVRGNYIYATLSGGATTFSFSNARLGTTYILFLRQDSSGNNAHIFPSTVRWPGSGATPSFNYAANTVNVVTLTPSPFGTNILLGNLAGTGYNVS